MATANINLLENLMDKITQMDGPLLQRLNDYATGLMDAAANPTENWWDLTEEDLEKIEKSERQIDEGQGIPMDEVIQKYKAKLNL